MIDVELISILANATDKTQKPFIRRAIEYYKKVQSNEEDELVYFKNSLKQKLRLIFGLSIKDKAHLLLDYLKIILDASDDYNDYEWHNN